jgi:hypothetical protein
VTGFREGLRSVEKVLGTDDKTVWRQVEAARAPGLERDTGEAQLTCSSLWCPEPVSGANGVFRARSQEPKAIRRHMRGAEDVNRT